MTSSLANIPISTGHVASLATSSGLAPGQLIGGQMKPPVRIDSFKLEYMIEDAISKIVFLGKINESEDNSSELAGFEINKLLKE